MRVQPTIRALFELRPLVDGRYVPLKVVQQVYEVAVRHSCCRQCSAVLLQVCVGQRLFARQLHHSRSDVSLSLNIDFHERQSARL